MDLYSSSIVAVEIRTGKLKWYFQFAHHDMWDFDGPQPTVLFDLNGIPALYHTSKTGYAFILDRRTGKSLFPYMEKSPRRLQTAKYLRAGMTGTTGTVGAI